MKNIFTKIIQIITIIIKINQFYNNKFLLKKKTKKNKNNNKNKNKQ